MSLLEKFSIIIVTYWVCAWNVLSILHCIASFGRLECAVEMLSVREREPTDRESRIILNISSESAENVVKRFLSPQSTRLSLSSPTVSRGRPMSTVFNFCKTNLNLFIGFFLGFFCHTEENRRMCENCVILSPRSCPLPHDTATWTHSFSSSGVVSTH